MLQHCEACGEEYDDVFHYTICPHEYFEPSPDAKKIPEQRGYKLDATTTGRISATEVGAMRGPQRPLPSGTEAEVCVDIAMRQLHGINKYGTTVADNPLTLKEWLQHAYEECLDQAIYLKRAIQELDKPPKRNPNILRHYFQGKGNQCDICGNFHDHDIHA